MNNFVVLYERVENFYSKLDENKLYRKCVIKTRKNPKKNVKENGFLSINYYYCLKTIKFYFFPHHHLKMFNRFFLGLRL